MSRSKVMWSIAVVLAVGLGVLSTTMTTAQAQQQATPGASRTILSKQDLSVPGREGVLVITQLPPGAKELRHTHAADIFVYVLEGTVTLHQDGQPDQTLSAGQNFFVKEGTVHGASNEGKENVKMLVTFFAEKGKPLTTPVRPSWL